MLERGRFPVQQNNPIMTFQYLSDDAPSLLRYPTQRHLTE